MIIQTLHSEFLIESCSTKDGCLYIYSNNAEELQRFFGSAKTEISEVGKWKYRTRTCKQDLANALIHLVKEIDYSQFSRISSVLN
ncbi:hypothetical protein [Algoriphagus mannitolivorans]|uniref:hypothetical protein n=1 Tax=Algoriphagus mannitolivorans TaxID=226504 RepID=UPI00047C2572|nr:hypothetical protein [Algoriphagus mannitolivorans]